MQSMTRVVGNTNFIVLIHLYFSGPLWIQASLLNGLPWLDEVTYPLTY